MFAVRRFHHNQIKLLRILSIGEKPGTIEQADGASSDNQGVVVQLQHGGISRIPTPAERFAAELAVREQANFCLQFERLKPTGVEEAANLHTDGRSDTGRKGLTN